MNQQEKEILIKKVAETWGVAQQLVMVCEVTAELQKDVCKIIRGDWSSARMDSLASEIADVSIMLDQLVFITKTASKVEIQKGIKLERLAKRLRDDKGFYELI